MTKKYIQPKIDKMARKVKEQQPNVNKNEPIFQFGFRILNKQFDLTLAQRFKSDEDRKLLQALLNILHNEKHYTDEASLNHVLDLLFIYMLKPSRFTNYKEDDNIKELVPLFKLIRNIFVTDLRNEYRQIIKIKHEAKMRDQEENKHNKMIIKETKSKPEEIKPIPKFDINKSLLKLYQNSIKMEQLSKITLKDVLADPQLTKEFSDPVFRKQVFTFYFRNIIKNPAINDILFHPELKKNDPDFQARHDLTYLNKLSRDRVIKNFYKTPLKRFRNRNKQNKKFLILSFD